MKAKFIETQLENVLNAKQRTHIGIFFSDQGVERMLLPRDSICEYLLQVDRFMRKILRSLVLHKNNVDSENYLPLFFDVIQGGGGVRIRLQPKSKVFIKKSEGFYPGKSKGYECSPLARMFYEAGCGIGLAVVVDQYDGKVLKSLDPISKSVASILLPVAEIERSYAKEIKNLDALVNANFASLHQHVHDLVRRHKALVAIELKLLYGDVWFERSQDLQSHFDRAKKDVKCLLHSKKHKDLNEKITGYIWKVEYAEEGARVHLILFLLPDVVEAPTLFGIQVGERWAKDVAAKSGGGYSTSWSIGGGSVQSYSTLLMNWRSKSWVRKMDEIICYVALQDLFRRYVGAEEEQRDVENDSSHAKQKNTKFRMPRSFGVGGILQDRKKSRS